MVQAFVIRVQLSFTVVILFTMPFKVMPLHHPRPTKSKLTGHV